MCEKTKQSVCSENILNSSHLSRRSVIHRTLAASAVVASGFVCAVNGKDSPESLPKGEAPNQLLDDLYAGNARFVEGKSMAAHRDMKRVREVAAQQKPFAAFLGCADSRVPIEIIFDQGFGDLFVTRIAGNVASSENIGSLEFGTQVLGARVLYVLGHTNCGAVDATMKGTEVPGQISGLFQYIRPAVKIANGNLKQAIIENVRNQAVLLAEASPVISKMIQRKELIVAGGIYDLATGKVSPIDVQVG